MLTRLCRENAAIAPPEILRCTQKLLDRVLFCAFCEDRSLLPADTLKRDLIALSDRGKGVFWFHDCDLDGTCQRQQGCPR